MSRRSSSWSNRNTPRVNTEILESRTGNTSSRGGKTPSRVVSSAPKVDVPPPEARHLSPVPLKVFAVASRHKPDQLAGFAAYAKAQKMKPKTMPEWEEALAAFMARPVK